jgi:hypothetical protein
VSQLDLVINDLIATVSAALPSYTDVLDGFIELRKIDAERKPIAMVFAPSIEQGDLAYQQTQEVGSYFIGLVRPQFEGAQMRTDLQAVIDAIEADPSLGGTVERGVPGEYLVDDTQTTQTLSLITIETSRVF